MLYFILEEQVTSSIPYPRGEDYTRAWKPGGRAHRSHLRSCLSQLSSDLLYNLRFFTHTYDNSNNKETFKPVGFICRVLPTIQGIGNPKLIHVVQRTKKEGMLFSLLDKAKKKQKKKVRPITCMNRDAKRLNILLAKLTLQYTKSKFFSSFF